ncbi:MAG: HAMP domain-containing protein [Sedimentisphaerales bacterium]|nr:HAMP domain-containing protein [Sedimentisphaerales bacterium]
MSIRRKIAFILILVLLLYFGLNFGIQKLVIYPSFVSMQQDEAHKNLLRCVEAMNREVHHLDTLMRDWAFWDDTVQFINDTNQEYIDSCLLPETYSQNRTNLFYFFDSNKKLVWGKAYDITDLRPINVPQSCLDKFLNSLNYDFENKETNWVDSPVTGIVKSEIGPMFVAVGPIIPSNLEGSPVGILLMARLITPEIVKHLVEQTQVEFKIWELGEEELSDRLNVALNQISDQNPYFIEDTDTDLLLDYTTLKDIYGKPALLVQAYIPKKIMQQGTNTIRYARVSSIVGSIIILVVLTILLQRTIVTPLKRLKNHAIHLGNTNDLSARIQMKRRDEIGTLAQEFDNMVKRLEDTHKKLLEQSYYTGMADIASGTLHNIRNALTPVAAQLCMIREELHNASLEKIDMACRELEQGNASPERNSELANFIETAHKDLLHVAKDIYSQLDEIQHPIANVEKILVRQDEFSRASGTGEMLNLSDLIKDSLTLVPDRLMKQVVLDVSPSIKNLPAINSHRISLLQIFSNVITNALESIEGSSQKFGRITISASEERNDTNHSIHILVEDNGRGIEADALQHLFEREFSTKPNGCSGIGLHWCANTIIGLQGNIYARSDGPGKGARVHILIPMKDQKVTNIRD